MTPWPAGCHYYPPSPRDDINERTVESTRLPILEGCLISELANGQYGDQQSQPMARDKQHRGVWWQPPARETRQPARADSDEPDASRADAQAVGRRSGFGAEDEAGLARTEDGAGGGPAEEHSDVRAGTWHAAAQDLGIPDTDASQRSFFFT